MFGFDLLFGWALLALPLAAAPVVLHLLFRRKSPVVPFSTLRFVRASVQQTAARKRIQQWLLLAARVLLLALLIWAIAQPARKLASNWMGNHGSTVAAIVIDDSYSMMLRQNHVSRLDVADDAVQDLLRTELRAARVAIFKSLAPPGGRPEPLLPASEILSQWSPLKPSPAPHPLADRVAAAVGLLDREQAADKWLIVVSDLQSHEFPRPLPAFTGERFALLDLHPDDARTTGITNIAVDPAQPIPGVSSDVVVDLSGKVGDSRAVAVSISGVDGKEIFASAPTMANLENAGRAQLRFPVRLPAERFVELHAKLSGSDDMPWDDSRTLLVGVPPRLNVRVLESEASSPPDRAIMLALDPTENRDPAWPLQVRRGTIADDDRAVVVVASQWPAERVTQRLVQLLQNGGNVVLFLRPGMERSWQALPAPQRATLETLLPALPDTRAATGGTVVVTADRDPLFSGLTDEHGAFPPAHVRQAMPFAIGTSTTTDAAPLLGITSDASSGPPRGLLYRKSVGRGTVYTLATWPDALDSNLATNPDFLPMLVRMCLPAAGSGVAHNVDLGEPLEITTPTPTTNSSASTLTIQTPDGGTYAVAGTATPGGTKYRFDRTNVAGIYLWKANGAPDSVAASNVQLPATESELVYHAADQIAPSASNVIVARSLADLRVHLSKISEPEPHWSGAIALVLLLICLESLMASTKGLWKPIRIGMFGGRVAAD